MNGVTRRDFNPSTDPIIEPADEESKIREKPKTGPMVCHYGSTHDFEQCGWETIVSSMLFVKGKGDVGEVDANDIQQRRVGDCHLLGPALALASSAEGRARLRNMIEELPSVGGKKQYEVTFRTPTESGSSEQKVVVDDTFVKGHAATADQQDGKQEIWPLVLESAYAKLRGGMQKIGHGGAEAAAFEAITGKKASSQRIGANPGQCADATFRSSFAAGKPMCVSFDHALLGPTAEWAFGLHASHSYAVSALIEKNGETYVQLRNPWGHSDPDPVPLRMLSVWSAQVTMGDKP